MENNKPKTLQDILTDTGISLEDMLKTEAIPVVPIHQGIESIGQVFDEFQHKIDVLGSSMMEILNQLSYFSCMITFLLERYNDLVNLHRADLDFEKIQQDKDELNALLNKFKLKKA